MQTPDLTGEKDLPLGDVEAEEQLLALLLLNPSLYEEIGSRVEPLWFFSKANRLIFQAIVELADSEKVIGLTSVAQRLQATETLEGAGGISRLRSLVEFIPSTPLESVLETLAELAKRRALVGLGQKIIRAANSLRTPLSDTLAEVEAMTLKALQDRTGAGTVISLADAALKWLADMEHLAERPVLNSKFPDLDKVLGGIRQPILWVVAARPSVGKTSFVSQVSQSVAKQGIPILFFSFEMSAEQLVEMEIFRDSGLSPGKLRWAFTGQSLPGAADIVQKGFTSIQKFSSIPFYISPPNRFDLAKIRGEIQYTNAMLKKEGSPPLGVIALDYLQLMVDASDVGAISAATKGLKRIALEFNLAVLLVSQLSRGVEARQDKKPQMADLRGSGTIEEDADVILGLYRPDYYETNKSPTPQCYEAEIVVLKNRFGPNGLSVPMLWNAPRWLSRAKESGGVDFAA